VSVYAPGRAAFPFHSHRVNDELFYIMEGHGQVRIGNDTHNIKQGDFIGLPADSGNAHQIKNTGDQPLKVLALSSSLSPEVAEYPEIGKIGVLVGKPPMGEPDERSLRKFFRMDDAVEYWDGVD
ncbi:MAG: cupin domain-containing protein, partial [Gammaproteobacteria bacterium]